MNEKKEVKQIKEAAGLLTLGILLFGYLLNYDAYLLQPETTYPHQAASSPSEISTNTTMNASTQVIIRDKILTN